VEPENENDATRCDCIINRDDLILAETAAGDRQQGFPKMINTLARGAALGAIMTLLMSFVSSASAQGPSEAQREAVKAQCRSEYMAHCSSIPPGGEASLQCLAKNMSSLSPSCQAAVRAVEASVEAPKPAAATPPAAAAKPGAPATAAKPATPAPAAKGTAAKQPASAPATTTAAAPAGAAAAPAPLVLRKMLPREELFVTRSACSTDIGTLCQGVVPGGGRIMQCLSVRSVSLTQPCRDVLAPFAVQ
jgi:hypothetical protein